MMINVYDVCNWYPFTMQSQACWVGVDACGMRKKKYQTLHYQAPSQNGLVRLTLLTSLNSCLVPNTSLCLTIIKPFPILHGTPFLTGKLIRCPTHDSLT